MTLFSSAEGVRDGRFLVKSAFVDIDLGFRVLNKDGRRIWNGCMFPHCWFGGGEILARGMTITFMISVIEWRNLTAARTLSNRTPPKIQLLAITIYPFSLLKFNALVI
jgi:hypothetical protein